MNGKEHYEKAEQLLRDWEDQMAAAGANKDHVRLEVVESMGPTVLACAQAHATLALTQATLVVLEAADWEKPSGD